ncbi:4'-phosphopantetheinyl transferase family protein [Streptomyces sp. NPDC058576]|uniref:4'-phosphopantetheinyl transferase family protein n=1 Tax=Streptomyces sp. NPDC058576 TaxID=3346547 RepID=UPI003655854D
MSTVLVFDIDRLPDTGTARFRRAVPADRRARADNYHFPDDRKRCLAAGVLLRYALLVHHGLREDELPLSRNRFGKPYLAHRPDLHFSLSHSGRWVVCATSGKRIGVDIEHVDAGTRDIAHRFTPDEHAYVAAAPPAERARRLIQIWTLKESYLKCVGSGLTTPLNSFSTHPASPSPAPGLFLKQIPHECDYWLAECGEDDSSIDLRHTAAEDLLAVC